MSAALFEKYRGKLYGLSSYTRFVHSYNKAWKMHGLGVVLERNMKLPDVNPSEQRFKIVANLSTEDHLVEAWGLPQSMTFQEALILLRLHGNDL